MTQYEFCISYMYVVCGFVCKIYTRIFKMVRGVMDNVLVMYNMEGALTAQR